MNRTYIFFIFMLFYGMATAQVSLSRSVDDVNSNALDSVVAAAIHIPMDSVGLIVLSASDTGFMADKRSPTSNKKGCVIAFIGCDESHVIISDFMIYFYSEYFKTSSYETAFFNARKYLSDKHPHSPVAPVMNCKE